MPRLTKADISGPSNFQHVSGTDRSGHTFGLETYNDQEPKTETKENEKPSSPNKTPVSRKKVIKLFQNKKGQKIFQVHCFQCLFLSCQLLKKTQKTVHLEFFLALLIL